ncbi:Myb-like DNA-binding domain-containing protein [Moorella naiadis]|uniref:SANT/Myb-like DNA-binding domain-containing protein n=1 Tax=Moorella naiadis (nom. illeg.) TaxID=3093670 RepID=UPI003D9C8F63
MQDQKIIWTTKKEKELLEGIAGLMKEGKMLSHAVKEMAEKMGISYGSALWRYYKDKRRHGKTVREAVAEVVNAEVSLKKHETAGGTAAAGGPTETTAGAAGAGEITGKTAKNAENQQELPSQVQEFPSLMMRQWTLEEDAVLLQGVAEGKSFDEIVKDLPGRTVGAVKKRYERLKHKIGAQAQANVQKYKTYNQVDALNMAYKFLRKESRTTGDGRLDYKQIERIAALTGLPYAKVLSLWGAVNRPGFWSIVELHKLEDIVDSQKVEIEALRRELKERAEAMDKYVNRAEKVKAALRAKLAEGREALAEQEKQYKILMVLTRTLQDFARSMKSWANDYDFKMATQINLD